MMSSNVPAAIRDPGIFFFLPYPLSLRLVTAGTKIEGEMHAMLYPRTYPIGKGILNKP